MPYGHATEPWFKIHQDRPSARDFNLRYFHLREKLLTHILCFPELESGSSQCVTANPVPGRHAATLQIINTNLTNLITIDHQSHVVPRTTMLKQAPPQKETGKDHQVTCLLFMPEALEGHQHSSTSDHRGTGERARLCETIILLCPRGWLMSDQPIRRPMSR